MLTAIRPALDPLAHRAAIQALDAQRAAYTRFARTLDAQRAAVAGADDPAAAAGAAAELAARGLDDLAEGARRLGPLLDAANAGADAAAREEMARRLDAARREAQAAEAAMHNLTTQLEAWRDAYGRQLAGLGLAPGAAEGEAPNVPAPGDPAARGYGPRRPGDRAPQPPTLIDRRG